MANQCRIVAPSTPLFVLAISAGVQSGTCSSRFWGIALFLAVLTVQPISAIANFANLRAVEAALAIRVETICAGVRLDFSPGSFRSIALSLAKLPVQPIVLEAL